MNRPEPNPAPPPLSAALRLAGRELRGGLRGFRIFLACLALGVAAIAGVQSVASGIFSGMRDDGRTLLGGDVAVRTVYREPGAEQLDYLRRTSAELMYFIETRTMARAPDQDASLLVELKAVDDNYPAFGEVELRGGLPYAGSLERRDDAWGALIEPGLAERLELAVGDRLSVAGRDYRVRGIIEREPDRAGAGGNFGFWPRVMIDRASLDGSDLLAEGSMLYHQYRLRLPPDVAPEVYRERLAAAFPDAGWRVRDFRNAAPRLEEIIGRVTLFLTLVGLTALLVGGVGVSNAVRAHLDSKLTTLAMLKCIGAPRRTLFQTYLAQLLVLAAAGIVIGLAVGAAMPPIAARLLAELVPVPVQLGVYPGALVLAALFGLLTTLTFAVLPLARAVEIPGAALFRAGLDGIKARPRRRYLLLTLASAVLLATLAIATAIDKRLAVWFVLGALATLLAFRLAAAGVMRIAARLRRPRRPGLRLALTNLHRPGSPTPSVVLSLGLGLTVLVTIGLIEGNMRRQIQENIPEQAPSFFFLDIQSAQIDGFRELIEETDGTSRLMTVPYLRGPITRVKGLDPATALVNPDDAWMIRGDRGLTYATEPPENATTVAGEWWPADYAGPPLLSVHADAMQAFDLALGDSVTFNVLGREITGTVAHVRDLEWSSLQLNFAFMFSPEPLRSAPHGYLATVVATPEAELAVQRQLADDYPSITAIRIKDALDRANEISASIGAAVRIIAVVTLLAGTLVLAGAIAAGHRRRIYDSVILKVLGATRRDVLRAFLLEYGLLGLITAAIAAVIGTVTAWAVLTRVMRTDWVFIPETVLLTTLLCTAITLAFGFAGTWRALGQKAAPLLRNE